MKVGTIILAFVFCWIPSLLYCQTSKDLVRYQHIIAKGFPAYYSKHAEHGQYRYMQACEKLGDFFAQQFTVRKLRANAKAVKYYKLAADYNFGTDSETHYSDRMVSISERICKKLGDILLGGKGVKLDKQSAFFYHTKVNMSTKEIKIYSKKYFGTYQKIYDLNTQLVTIVPNPFEYNFSVVDFKNVASIQDAKRRLDSAKNLVILIFYTGLTHWGQFPCYKVDNNSYLLKSYLVTNIATERVVYPDDYKIGCGNNPNEIWLGGISVDGITLSFEYQKEASSKQ